MTAIEWLLEQIENKNGKEFSSHYSEFIETAKLLEELQHNETWIDSTTQFNISAEMTYKKDFDDYFNEKFKKK